MFFQGNCQIFHRQKRSGRLPEGWKGLGRIRRITRPFVCDATNHLSTVRKMADWLRRESDTNVAYWLLKAIEIKMDTIEMISEITAIEVAILNFRFSCLSSARTDAKSGKLTQYWSSPARRVKKGTFVPSSC